MRARWLIIGLMAIVGILAACSDDPSAADPDISVNSVVQVGEPQAQLPANEAAGPDQLANADTAATLGSLDGNLTEGEVAKANGTLGRPDQPAGW